VHYKELTDIVKTTAKEYGMPYHVKPSFYQAIKDHTKMLRHLGQKQELSLV
jgi:linoleoyl-CoA desaturase